MYIFWPGNKYNPLFIKLLFMLCQANEYILGFDITVHIVLGPSIQITHCIIHCCNVRYIIGWCGVCFYSYIFC